MPLADFARNAFQNGIHNSSATGSVTIGTTTSAATTAATITLPLKLRLVTTASSASAAGTTVTGGTGPYADQTLAGVFSTASASGSISSVTVVNFTGMPGATVTGVEIIDSTATPNRLEYGTLTASRTTLSGDTVSFAAGQITSLLQ